MSTVCRAAYYQLRHLRPLIRSLSSDAAKMLNQAFTSTPLDYCNSLMYGISERQPVLTPKPCKMPQHASSPTRERTSTSRLYYSSYIGFQSANVCNSRSPCWCTRYCTTSCLRIGRKIANLCLSLARQLRSSDFVGHRHVPSSVNQHKYWRSLIRHCWN